MPWSSYILRDLHLGHNFVSEKFINNLCTIIPVSVTTFSFKICVKEKVYVPHVLY